MTNNQELPNQYVQVLFDYDYTNETEQGQGEIVSIRENEVYRLLDKNNEEWWEVLGPNSKNVDESFYLPFNYVKEISESEVKAWLSKSEKEKDKDKKQKDKGKKKDKEVEKEKDKKSKKEKEKEKQKEKEKEKEKEKDKKDKDKPKSKDEKDKSITKQPDKAVEAKAPPKDADDSADSSKFDNRTGSLRRGTPGIYPNLHDELNLRFRNSLRISGSGSATTADHSKTAGNMQLQDINIDSPSANAAKAASVDDGSSTESGDETNSIVSGAPTADVGQTDLQPLYENLAKLRALAAEKERRTAAKSRSFRASNDNLLNRDSGTSKKQETAEKAADKDKDKDKISVKSDKDKEKDAKTASLVRRLEISEPTELRALEKRGLMLKTRIFERGVRVSKKKWQETYVILSGALFMFYRDAKAAFPREGAPFGSPEAILELKYASFEFPASRELTSRKAALLLAFKTAPPSNQIRFGYLLACSDELKMREWSNALQIAQTLVVENKLPKGINVEHNPLINVPIETIQLVQGGNQPSRVASQKKVSSDSQGSKPRAATNEKPSVDEKRVKPASGASSVTASPAAVPVDEAERKRVKDRLKHFFTRRPGIETAQVRSIMRDDLLTFGSRIDLICKREQRSVPAFVERCMAYVEQRGLKLDGIYRLSGNQAHIQKLRCQVDQYDNYDLDGWDVHVVTGALKLFFRELKDPLVPISFGNSFRDAASLGESGSANARRKRFRELLTNLQRDAPYNMTTLKALIIHLRRVVEHASENRMQFANLAIVFGPSLFGNASSTSAASAMGSAPQPDAKDVTIVLWQAEIVQIFLEDFNSLFAPS